MAVPLDCGYLGLLVMCENPYWLANSANCSDEYCGLLSDITVSGIPCHENILFRWLMMFVEVVDDNLAVSIKRE